MLLNRIGWAVRFALSFLVAVVVAMPAGADIFEWEFIDPGNPALGKQQSTTLVPDGAGVDALPNADLMFLDLTMAHLAGSNLRNASLLRSTLTNADFSGADLTNARLTLTDLTGADLTGTDLTGADVVNAGLDRIKGFTEQQLASTASYQAGDLTQISLEGLDMSGWDLSRQVLFRANLTDSNLTGANLSGSDLTATTLIDTVLSGSTITGANFTSALVRGLTEAVFVSTGSYQAGDLRGVILSRNNLTGWDLSGQDLTGANLFAAVLIDVDLSGSIVSGTDFSSATSRGLTEAMLASTASYKAGDLSGILLAKNDMTGWDFTGLNLARAVFIDATLMSADLSGAMVNGVDFTRTVFRGLTEQQLASTASYLSGDLSGVMLIANDLAGWDFSGLDLTGASVLNSTLTGTVFTDSIVVGFDFTRTTGRGFVEQQLVSTASYQAGQLRGIVLDFNDLAGWDLSGQDLAMGSFIGSTMTGSDLSGSDTRGTSLTDAQIVSAADTSNLIWPDGTMRDGLVVGGGTFRVGDLDPVVVVAGDADAVGRVITIQDAFDIDPAGTLRVVFEDLNWGSLIQFDPSVGTAFLGGTLELGLELGDGLVVEDFLGGTFRLFDWTGVTIDGAFDQIAVDPAFTGAGLGFDTSQLYSVGEVTVVAVPEPAAGVVLGMSCLYLFRRRS
jgi:uncharacterized protein YjbI with pentapeptide repeats